MTAEKRKHTASVNHGDDSQKQEDNFRVYEVMPLLKFSNVCRLHTVVYFALLWIVRDRRTQQIVQWARTGKPIFWKKSFWLFRLLKVFFRF